VDAFFEEQSIDYVIVAAAKVGGILYNKRSQADFLYENMMISANTIWSAKRHGVKKLVFLGSSCIYPKLSPQPIKEEYLLSGPLEPTNEGYAIAKIAGLKLCEKMREQYGCNFVSAMPTNLYGPGDNFHPENSHVIPALMRRIHEAKEENSPAVTIWGTGQPKREFLHVEDLAEAIYFVMQNYDESETINIGTGHDCKIIELAELMRDIVGYKGDIVLDPAKPDGTPRKVLDVSKIRSLGWKPKYSLRDGLESTYTWALETNAFGTTGENPKRNA
jgi:GDP-L-fucose synthase